MPDEREEQTPAPSQPVELTGATLSADEKRELGQACYDAIQSGLNQRDDLDQVLNTFDSFYEQKVKPKNFPWPDSSNLHFPMVARIVNSLVARICGEVFVDNFYRVYGNTETAAFNQHKVQRFYNSEFFRFGFIRQHRDMTHLGVKDGTGIMEVMWEVKKETRNVTLIETVKDPMTGMELMKDPMSGELETQTRQEQVEIETINDVSMQAVELRDVVLVPSWSYSPEEALGVARKVFLDEKTLRAMASGPDAVLDMDAVEAALKYVPEGQDERALDRQGTSTADIGGNIEVTSETPASYFPMRRGGLLCWRFQTNLFDLDKDGIYEENLVWIHDTSQGYLGHKRYPYWAKRRPLFFFTPLRRPRRTYGWAITGSILPMATSKNILGNARLDEVTTRLSPPRWKKMGVKLSDKRQTWAPNQTFEVQDQNDVGIFTVQDIPISAWQSEAALEDEAERVAGLGDPVSGFVGTSGRRTKAEVQAAVQASGVQLGFQAQELRWTCKEILNFWHELNKQYKTDVSFTANIGGQRQRLQLTREELDDDYELTIAGMDGPMDKANYIQETIYVADMLKKDPLVMGSPQMFVRLYKINEMLLESLRRYDALSILGTVDEAQQMDQARAQAAQVQAQMAASGMGQPGGGAGGGPPQNGQPAGPLGQAVG
jgi:hypothetical protein